MKSTSVNTNGASVLLMRIHSFLDQVKQLTITEILSCLFAGIITQGTLFGTVKPFGIAYYAAHSKGVIQKTLMAVCIFIGGIVRADFFTALKQVAVILLYEWLKRLFTGNERDIPHLKNTLFIGGAVSITGLLIFFIQGKTLELILVLVMEAIFVSVLSTIFVMTPCEQDNISSDVEHKNLEFLGILILAAAFLLGVSGIQIAGVAIDQILAGLGLLMLARHFGPGFGACAGVVLGMTLSVALENAFISYTAIYAVSGMTCGMLQKSKWASGFGFFITYSLFLFLAGDIELHWIQMLLPVVLYWMLPDLKVAWLIPLQNRFDGNSLELERLDRIRKNITERLADMSRALYKLGFTVEKQIKTSTGDNEEAGAILEQLTQQVCSCCNRSTFCWETRLFHTCKAMADLVEVLQKDNPTGNEAERELNKFCIHPSLVIESLVHTIEIKRVDKIWKQKVLDSQSVIPEQIYCLSEILSKLSNEVFQDVEYFGQEEKKIAAMLRKKGFPVTQTEVRRVHKGRFSVLLRIEDCKGHKACPAEISSIVSKILGTQMQIEDDGCKAKGLDNCFIMLKEKENLGVTIGIARLKKDKATVSGDSFTFLKIREGKYVVAISDGMGSGREANRLSETAIGLFEQLLDCGVSVRLALSFVNMMFTVKNEEKYATMDISAIDLYTGETEFYKMGAMPSLIMNDRNLDYIQANNLPAGLHGENLIQPDKRKVLDGEFIVMMTDGVYDRISGGDGATLLENMANKKSTLNPQEMAEHLLQSACEDRTDISDDMTVLVAKLWRKAG